jgi:hypothetical protein
MFKERNFEEKDYSKKPPSHVNLNIMSVKI